MSSPVGDSEPQSSELAELANPHQTDSNPPPRSPPFSGIGRKRSYVEAPMSPIRDDQGNVILAPRVPMSSNSIRADFKLDSGDQGPSSPTSAEPQTQVSTRLQAMSYAALEKYSTFGSVVRPRVVAVLLFELNQPPVHDSSGQETTGGSDGRPRRLLKTG